MKKTIALLTVVLLLFGCKKDASTNVEKAFYYWQNSSMDGEKIDSLATQKIYYRIFEVENNEIEGNFPVNKNRPSRYELDGENILLVPTIFIRNEVFKNSDLKSLEQLADNIAFLTEKFTIDQYSEEKEFDYDEIQIDCDWTESTKDNYFYLLKKLKEFSKKKISCTLRLYPYAYPEKMGVPPVDKAMLMCYNLVSPLSDPKKNSVLDVSELKKYLVNKKKYPIHIDVALPLFSWSLIYHNNQFKQLQDVDESALVDRAKKIDSMWYEMTEDFEYNNATYLKTGDKIKVEKVEYQTLLDAIDVIKKNVKLDNAFTVSFFDFQYRTFKNYSNEEISALYSRFNKR
jgi:hypothetical protein